MLYGFDTRWTVCTTSRRTALHTPVDPRNLYDVTAKPIPIFQTLPSHAQYKSLIYEITEIADQ